MNRLRNLTLNVKSGHVWSKYHMLPMMLRYWVASTAGVVLLLDILNFGSMGVTQPLHPAMPAFSSSFLAYTLWHSSTPCHPCFTSMPR
jgi:hypothetical protein